jgi:hypothetical protein
MEKTKVNSQEKLFDFGSNIAQNLVTAGLSHSSPGSGIHLLNGPAPSTQSLLIKFGRAFEAWFEEAVRLGDTNFTVMPSGVWSEINKDLDLIFRDNEARTIYYRELKLNLNLDTEKIVSTYEKVGLITDFLRAKYPGYTIDSGVLTWGTYGLEEITAQSKVKKALEFNVKVEDPRSFFELVKLSMSASEYSQYFRSIGRMLMEAR